eukprot:scaffold316316_cov27-Prasinocladus_malaysianus.AAC.1
MCAVTTSFYTWIQRRMFHFNPKSSETRRGPSFICDLKSARIRHVDMGCGESASWALTDGPKSPAGWYP